LDHYTNIVQSQSVMAIINTTPDSFYSESRINLPNLISTCEKHISQGASILDIGGYSSRPGAVEVSEEEEIKRYRRF